MHGSASRAMAETYQDANIEIGTGEENTLEKYYKTSTGADGVGRHFVHGFR